MDDKHIYTGIQTIEEFEPKIRHTLEDAIPIDPASSVGDIALIGVCIQILHRVDEMTRMMRADFEDRRRRADDGK